VDTSGDSANDRRSTARDAEPGDRDEAAVLFAIDEISLQRRSRRAGEGNA